MYSGGCNSLQVSTQLSALVAGVPVNLSNNFAVSPQVGQFATNVVTFVVGTTPLPLGSITLAELGYLYVENLDMSNPLFISQNADGSLPFAKVGPGAHALIPVPSNQAYYVRVDSAPITALVAALSS